MANFCTNCGVSLPDDIKFCTDCGNKIGQEIPIEDKSKEIKEVENRSEISQDVNEIANNEGEIAENKRQISPTKSIENTSTGIDPKYIIIGIVALLIIGAVYTMRTSTSSSDNSNPGDIIKQPIQKSIQKSPERTIQKRTIQKIVVYGSNKSSDCNELTKQLKKRGLKYIFNDIDENDIFSRDLVKLVKDSGHKGGFAIPVVVINDAHVIIGADIDEIMRSK